MHVEIISIFHKNLHHDSDYLNVMQKKQQARVYFMIFVFIKKKKLWNKQYPTQSCRSFLTHINVWTFGREFGIKSFPSRSCKIKLSEISILWTLYSIFFLTVCQMKDISNVIFASNSNMDVHIFETMCGKMITSFPLSSFTLIFSLHIYTILKREQINCLVRRKKRKDLKSPRYHI